jgi:hypothetical protein
MNPTPFAKTWHNQARSTFNTLDTSESGCTQSVGTSFVGFLFSQTSETGTFGLGGIALQFPNGPATSVVHGRSCRHSAGTNQSDLLHSKPLTGDDSGDRTSPASRDAGRDAPWYQVCGPRICERGRSLGPVGPKCRIRSRRPGHPKWLWLWLERKGAARPLSKRGR